MRAEHFGEVVIDIRAPGQTQLMGTDSRAALHLHIAQPALSRQLSYLERELGVPLFDRVGRRLFLTGAGEQLLGSCRSLLGSVSALSEQAQLLRRGDTGVLKVAASPADRNSFSTFFHQYAQRYPNVQVKLIEAVGSQTLALLERGEIHLGISLLQSIQADDRHFGILKARSYAALLMVAPKRTGVNEIPTRLAASRTATLDSAVFIGQSCISSPPSGAAPACRN